MFKVGIYDCCYYYSLSLNTLHIPYCDHNVACRAFLRLHSAYDGVFEYNWD